MNKINEEYIRLYRKRAAARLINEYNEHQMNIINETFKRDKNYELLKKLTYFLEYYNNEDKEMKESRLVVFDSLYENIKTIKKEQVELEESEKKLINKGLVNEVKEEQKDEETNKTNKFHEEVNELYAKYLKLKEK